MPSSPFALGSVAPLLLSHSGAKDSCIPSQDSFTPLTLHNLPRLSSLSTGFWILLSLSFFLFGFCYRFSIRFSSTLSQSTPGIVFVHTPLLPKLNRHSLSLFQLQLNSVTTFPTCTLNERRQQTLPFSPFLSTRSLLFHPFEPLH